MEHSIVAHAIVAMLFSSLSGMGAYVTMKSKSTINAILGGYMFFCFGMVVVVNLLRIKEQLYPTP